MNSRVRNVIAGLGAVAAAGCAMLPSVGPDYEKPECEMPESILPDAGLPTPDKLESGEFKPAADADDSRTAITEADIQAWWMRFDDPVLSELVAQAVSNNVSFMMAQDRLIAARWALLGAEAAYWPQVNFVASAVRMERGKNTSSMAGTGKKLHRDVFAGGFDASWEIDIFGGTRRATEAAWAEAEAAGWAVADAQVSLVSEVGSQYLELRTTQQRIEVARNNLKLQSETYDILKSRFDSGIGDELAVSQSKYIVDQTLAAIPPLLAQESRLKDNLAILTGAMPGSLDALLSECPQRDWLAAPMKLGNVPLDMIRTRPDVRVAERKLAAEVAYVGVAKSQWYPKLYINGSLGLEAIHPDKLLKRDALQGSIGPAISWPIFRGGSIYASIKAQEARMDEAILNYEFALQKAYSQVREAYAAYTHEYHRYLALQGAVKAAEDAVAISKDLYKNGLRDFTAVIDAQRSLLNLAESLVVSRGHISQYLVSLYKSLGGGITEAGDAEEE